MNGTRFPRIALLSHGAALAIGGCGGWLLLGFSPPNPPSSAAASASVPSATATAAAWLDRTLDTIHAATTAAVNPQKLTVPELLRSNRREADRQLAALNARLDAIAKAAARYQHLADLAAAIATSFRRNESSDDALAMFQAWLDRDPDAALAHLGRNWRLQDAGEPLVPLLERKFGREWLLARLDDPATALRLKRRVAAGVGKSLAWNAGLAEALAAWRRIGARSLQDLLMEGFLKAWPLAEPATVTPLLAGDCPTSCRNRMLEAWVPPDRKDPFADTFGNGSVFTLANFEWFRQVRDSLDPVLVPKDLREITAASEPAADDSELSLAQNIAQRIGKPGATKERAVHQAIWERMAEVVSRHPAVVDDYAAGQLTRREMLDRLGGFIPGAEAYPEAVELAALELSAPRISPEQLMAWVAELRLTDERSLQTSEVFLANASADPRKSRALERYRLFLSDDRLATHLSANPYFDFLWPWPHWMAIAPQAATEWRNALPPGDALRRELDRRDEEEKASHPSP